MDLLGLFYDNSLYSTGQGAVIGILPVVKYVYSNSSVWNWENNHIISQLSLSVVSDSLRPHGLQHTSFAVQHQLPEFAQTHDHRVSDAIQISHPLLSPSPPAFNLSQHQGLFH